MITEKRIAQRHELAYYADGTIVHVGLCVGMNGGIDGSGFNHKAEYERRRAQGEYPTRFNGIRMSAVTEHMRNNARVMAHWRAVTEDVQRVMNDPESDFHKMAKQACCELVHTGFFHDMTKKNLRSFRPDGAIIEMPITTNGVTYYADVGVWDNRFKQYPIAMEITYSSGQGSKRVADLIEAGIKVYEINIYQQTLNALKNGDKVDKDFYRTLMLYRGFRELSGVQHLPALDVEIIKLDDLLDEERLRRAFEDVVLTRDKIENHSDETWPDIDGGKFIDEELVKHHENCRRCKHRYPCAYFLSSKCGPEYEFECV